MEVGKCKLELLRAALTCTTVDVVNVAGTMGESCVPFFLFLFFFFFSFLQISKTLLSHDSVCSRCIPITVSSMILVVSCRAVTRYQR